MPEKMISLPEMQRALSITPASLDKENRTVDVVFATETPVLTRNWSVSERNDGLYYEILSCDPAHVRLDRLKSGAPVLDQHSRYSIKDQLGVVDNARMEGKEGKAKIRFSKRDDVEPVWNDIMDSIIQNISAGYRVYKYEAVPGMGTDQVPTFRAVDWEPTEISLATVPADTNSKVRSNSTDNQVQIIHQNSRTMPENVIVPPAPDPEEGKRTAPPAPPAPAPPAPENVEQQRTEAITAERTRTMDIMTAVRSARLDNAFADKLIKDGVSIEKAREMIIAEFAKQDPNAGANANVRVSADEADKVRGAMTDALYLRAGGNSKGMKAEDVNGAREFRTLSLLDFARTVLERNNISTRMMTRREIAERALSTSDLPIILGSTVNRSLLAAYEEAPRTFMDWCRKATLSDFKQVHRARISSLPTLSLVGEGGEYKAGKYSDEKESYKLAKYGEIIPITWESIVNDDMDAFSRIPTMLANACAQKQSDIVYAILTGTPTMADGVALFEASNHGNYASSGTTIANGLAAAKAAMRKQKGFGSAGTKASGNYLNLEPAFLIVGPDKEVEALQILNAVIVAATTATANVFAGSMKPIVEPRVSGNNWYLSAKPTMVDTIEYAFLDGEPEIFTEQRQGFETDGLEIKVRMVFAAQVIDHRGLYKNVGA